MKTIYCPGYEKHIPLRAYIKGVKLAKANPDAEFKKGITCWWPCSGADIVKQFRSGMHDRINQGIPAIKRGI